VEPSAPFTLLSLNLHCFRVDGTVYATNAERFAAIASLAAQRDVAVITLQEACERPGEDAIELLKTALEQTTAATWTSTWALAHVAWEGTPDEADEGVGLLVRGALSDPAELEHAVQGALRRVAVSATLPPELGSPRVTSVHFEVFEPEARTMQAREVAAAALVDTNGAYSVIVAGDFNDVEGSATHASFPSMGYLAADTGLNPSGIDHVMSHRAAKLRPALVEEVFLGAEAVSDHPGILVRFEPATGDMVTATRITAQSDPGADHFLSVRGDTAPLSWDSGFPMRRVKPGEHAFVTTEIEAAFAFKVLLDDTTWQTGPNVEGVAGAAQVVMPVF
jgi:endonuclease/exonuclease/phosphatase family metal-dependent hydrolase